MNKAKQFEGFFRDLAEQGRARMEISANVKAHAASDLLVVASPLPAAPDQAVAVEFFDVPVSSAPGFTWRAGGELTNGRIEFSSVREEPARVVEAGLTRNSSRVESPDCAVSLRARETDAAVTATCLDLSAGGIGLQIPASVPLTVGDTVDVTVKLDGAVFDFAGRVAHVTKLRSNTRIGVRFHPMTHDAASPFFAALNELAGAPIVEMKPSARSVPAFFDALAAGKEARLSADVDLSRDGRGWNLSSPDTLLASARTLFVEAEDSVWHADIEHAGGAELILRQVRCLPLDTGDRRSSGYRVAAPRWLTAKVRRVGESLETDVKVSDLSRGGVGLLLPIEMEPKWMESWEVLLQDRDGLSERFLGRVVFARRAEDHFRVGVAFMVLSNAQSLTLNSIVGSLEDGVVLRRFAIAGAGFLVFVLLLMLVGFLAQ